MRQKKKKDIMKTDRDRQKKSQAKKTDWKEWRAVEQIQ